jgi:hypothetical protein
MALAFWTTVLARGLGPGWGDSCGTPNGGYWDVQRLLFQREDKTGLAPKLDATKSCRSTSNSFPSSLISNFRACGFGRKGDTGGGSPAV